MAQSRVEAILEAAASSKTYKGKPLSRVEKLLMDVDEYIDEGGGGGQPPSEDQDFDDMDVDDIMSVISSDNNNQ